MMVNKLKIMQVCAAPGPGGAEGFFLRLVKALSQCDEAEVCPVVRNHSWLSNRLTEARIPHRCFAFGGRLDFLTRRRLAALMREWRPDLAQSWMNRATQFLPRGIVPTVGRLGGYYDLKYYKGIDWLIGNTQDICRHIRESGFPPTRVLYMPNFVDLPPDGFKAEGENVRLQYGIPEEAPLILMAGRLHPNKGFDAGLAAFAQLEPDTHLLLAGAGEEEEALRTQAATLGISSRVHFTGWINSITPLFAAGDLFVIPSRIEPLGNVFLEAWAHAMPVVSTASEGPGALIQNGKNGLLVPIDDVTALSETMRKVLSNPALAAELAEKGIASLQAQFGQQTILDRHLAFYQKIAQN